jgi:hypothetical protein
MDPELTAYWLKNSGSFIGGLGVGTLSSYFDARDPERKINIAKMPQLSKLGSATVATAVIDLIQLVDKGFPTDYGSVSDVMQDDPLNIMGWYLGFNVGTALGNYLENRKIQQEDNKDFRSKKDEVDTAVRNLYRCFSKENVKNLKQILGELNHRNEEIGLEGLEDSFFNIAHSELENNASYLRRNRLEVNSSDVRFKGFKYGDTVYSSREDLVNAVISNRKDIPEFSEGSIKYVERILEIAANWGNKNDAANLEEYLSKGRGKISRGSLSEALGLGEMINVAYEARIISQEKANEYRQSIKQAFDEGYSLKTGEAKESYEKLNKDLGSTRQELASILAGKNREKAPERQYSSISDGHCCCGE